MSAVMAPLILNFGTRSRSIHI